MKKPLLLFFAIITCFTAFAQPAGMINETFHLKYLQVGETYYTPNGENPNLLITENSGTYFMEAGGIGNQLFGPVTFSGNTMTSTQPGVTLHDCLEPNCYYENLYFYSILTNNMMEAKTLTYNYSETNGVKYLRLTDANNNVAQYNTMANEDPDPNLFQTWYLYMSEVDLGDPVFYPGPNPPQLTIHQDLSYSGIDDCALIDGDFIFSEGEVGPEFILQPINFEADESNCNGAPDYSLFELQIGEPLRSLVYEGNDGIDYFQYEYFAGFVYHFRNQLLETPENSVATFKLFPNPAEEKLFIDSGLTVSSATITDLNGRIVLLREGETIKEINISALNSGMYFITLTSSQGNITKKFVKK